MTARLDHLEVFADVARHGGFRAAATARGVSSSAISQSVGALEDALGLRLFNRTTRSLSLTEAGTRLFGQVAPALGDIRRAIGELDQLRDSPSGMIRINAPAPAVDHVLLPLASRFLAKYPAVQLDLVSDAAIVDIVGQGFDAGVRFGNQLEQDMIAIPVGPPLRYAYVVSPEYLRHHPVPEHPRDLFAHNCIRRRFAGGALASWRFAADDEAIEIAPTGRLTVGSAQQELQAALAGQGIAHLFDKYVREDLEAGRLVEVLADWSPVLPSWYLYYPNRRHPSAAMRAFLAAVRSFDWAAADGTAR